MLPHLSRFLVIITLLITPCSSSKAQEAIAKNPLGYDIVYVRYPDPGKGKFVGIPQGERPYEITMGADLIHFTANGEYRVLYECDNKCSVMDPAVSYDATHVYFSLVKAGGRKSASWLYKIRIKDKKLTRLTFNNGFDSKKYAKNTSEDFYLDSYRHVRDMAPYPLSNGKIVFTSNRSALTAFNPDTDAIITGSVQQLYIMDDHDGSLKTPAEANMKVLENGTLHMAQHPFQLLDGRIMFSTWQDAGPKYLYAMTSLFTVHPDGSNLQQFTEPHDHHKMLEHFATQLPDEQIVTGYYYPSFDYGYGVLLRYPLDPDGPDYIRGSSGERFNWGKKFRVSYRELDRKGLSLVTPHTTPNDVPAPNRSGKYSMPSVGKNNDLLVAYSKGSVNFFNAKCKKGNRCDPLQSGIYAIKNADTNVISHPKELVEVIDEPNHNEIWPRALVPYEDIYGVKKPHIIPSIDSLPVADKRLQKGEAAALVGTSSMYNRDSENGKDKFKDSPARELHNGNWTIQGAHAGVFDNRDIAGVRIVATRPKPFTKPLNKYKDPKTWHQVRTTLLDGRIDDLVAQYGSTHGEMWEILGEFPLSNKEFKDGKGMPDTSWLAKVPSDTPFLIHTLDKNGMTLISELTWRALKPGEVRKDCGGCHAHSITPTDFESTQAAISDIFVDKNAITAKGGQVKRENGAWDLTDGNIPLLENDGVVFTEQASVQVEFGRDVLPVLKKNCYSCHGSNLKNTNGLKLYSRPIDAYNSLMLPKKNQDFSWPQVSKYIRTPQARQSLLVWIAYGMRLDGRSNMSRKNDIDMPKHPVVEMPDKEKRTIARWVDLGSPIDLANAKGFAYTDDNQLPVIALHMPTVNEILVGAYDLHSGVDWSSIEIQYKVMSGKNLKKAEFKPLKVSKAYKTSNPNIFKFNILGGQLKDASDIIIIVTINDNVGNLETSTIKMMRLNQNSE